MTLDATAVQGGVRWIGAQREVLSGDIRGHVDVSDLAATRHLYGLGPLEGVRGEVSIFGSVPSIARIERGAVVTSRVWDVRACFLVWAQVEQWHAQALVNGAADLETLERMVVALAQSRGIDVHRPFAFHVDGLASEAVLHVLDKRDGLPHTAERHEEAKVRQRLTQVPIELIGFHSRHHRGVFTPGNSNVHVHGRTTDGLASGHLEEIRLAPGARIAVPGAGWAQ